MTYELRSPVLPMPPTQTDLRQPVLPFVDPSRHMTRSEELDRQAFAFLDARPWVWRMFVEYTNMAMSRSFRVSSKAVVERIRWEASFGDVPGMVVEDTDRVVRLNNNHAASFARIFEATYPEHSGVFEMRTRPASSVPAKRCA